MVGSHIYSALKKSKNKLIIADKKSLNLLDQSKVFKFLKEKTHRVEIYKKNEENLYVTSYSSLLIDN